MKVVALTFFFVFTVRGQFIQNTNVDDWQIPLQVKRCAASLVSPAVTSFTLSESVNPYYLRGDFDGDGFMDLAIALRGATDDTKSGTGICRAKGRSVLLGSLAKGHVFNNDIAESVPSNGWTVVSRDALMEILRLSRPPRSRLAGLRRKLAQGKGEVIYFTYEDGEGVIIYNDKKFEWYTINSLEFEQDIPK